MVAVPHQVLRFQTREEAFGQRVVPAIATTTHAANDAMVTEQLTILRASVLPPRSD